MIASASPNRVVIVGGGIIGLAVAESLVRRRRDVRVTLLEKEAGFGMHQTSHNSGVIHSGLYYAPGSLKARMAVAGATTMRNFCRQHSLPHEICGKVVVATTEAEIPLLRRLHERAIANRVGEIELIGPARLRELEPFAAGLEALHVRETGIVDFKAVAEKLVELTTAAGGEVRTKCKFLSAQRMGGEWELLTTTGTLRATQIVNCAGLHSDRVSAAAGSSPTVRIVPFRGEYFRLVPNRSYLVRNLIYPVPDPAFPFLGVHFTRMVGGGVEAGPNAVLALKREGYRRTDLSIRDTLDIAKTPGFWSFVRRHWKMGFFEMWRSWNKPAFVRALQRLIPEIRASDLEPGGAGVRAQALGRQGELIADFQIDESPGALHLLNAPSPAATASLEIGEYVAAKAVAALH